MHSFHHSRGRVLFEVLCALTVSVSCAGAWLQTGASAFLPAAAAAALYALVHAFDLAKARPALAAPTPAVETPADEPGKVLFEETMAPQSLEEAPPAEPIAADALSDPPSDEQRKPRRAKAPRKTAKGSAKATVTELKPVEIALVAPESDKEDAPVPIAPLFEPEPFVRQQRTVFGRKSG